MERIKLTEEVNQAIVDADNIEARAMTVEIKVPSAIGVEVSENTLSVGLNDGRTISVPVGRYPRLTHATPQERDTWKIIGGGQGIHWEDIDEDISVEGLLRGKPSGESQSSLRKWLKSRDRKYRP